MMAPIVTTAVMTPVVSPVPGHAELRTVAISVTVPVVRPSAIALIRMATVGMTRISISAIAVAAVRVAMITISAIAVAIGGVGTASVVAIAVAAPIVRIIGEGRDRKGEESRREDDSQHPSQHAFLHRCFPFPHINESALGKSHPFIILGCPAFFGNAFLRGIVELYRAQPIV